MKYHVKSLWAGKYAHTKQGLTNELPLAIWWFISWTILEGIRVLKLNHYHYGNIFGIGKKLSAADVRWLPRYSSTMEDDKMGRWARVAYAGKFDNIGFYRCKVCRWEIAWVKKLEIKGELKFTISYLYPSNGKHLFDNLEDAQKEVEQTFRWFMKMCGGKISCR